MAAAKYLGIDFGTSGARAIVIDDEGSVLAEKKQSYGENPSADWAVEWRSALFQLISSLEPGLRSEVGSIAFDGTSATALLINRSTGAALVPPKLYNESQGKEVVALAQSIAPPTHTATASTSTLCKLLTWHTSGVLAAHSKDASAASVSSLASSTSSSSSPAQPAASSSAAAAAPEQSQETAGPLLLHQADWLAGLLHGRWGVSDWNNALKLGYDPGAEAYPPWLTQQPYANVLPPTVLPPGAPIAPVTAAVAAETGLSPSCIVCAGTTDSIAAFIAANVHAPGQAVSSLGSTLAVKLLSTTRVDDAAYGVYSHRLGDVWLVGGASNTGGAVLRQHFTDAQLTELTPRLRVDKPTGLDYYPLTCPGERFPVNDPNLQPRLEPRPDDDAVFLQGIFEGIARIEAEAYAQLARLGASPVTEVVSAGGGAINPQWTAIRAAALKVPVRPATQGEAAYGAALLARQGFRQHKQQTS